MAVRLALLRPPKPPARIAEAGASAERHLHRGSDPVNLLERWTGGLDPSQFSRPGGRLGVGDRRRHRAGHEPRRSQPTRSGDIGPASRTRSVLVADETDATRAFIADNLSAEGYRVRTAASREKALAVLTVDEIDVIVIDVNGSTLALIDAVRAGDGFAGRVDPNVPMIVLSAQANVLQRIRMLDRGGDDVLAKPFSYPELRARIAAVLRRAEARRAPRLVRVGELSVDPVARTVRVAGQLVELTGKEYELLRVLASEPTRVLTKVNFGPSRRTARGARDSGARGRIGDPIPPGKALALAAWLPSIEASLSPQTELSGMSRFGTAIGTPTRLACDQAGPNANRIGRSSPIRVPTHRLRAHIRRFANDGICDEP
jgi:DNA-binding response OmpR family regulator